MSRIAIKAENISKQYRLGEIGTGTISHDLNRWWHKVRGKEDPFLKIGESNNRSQKGESDYVWSLKDINFEINQGDAVGIIGRNGAGKSTLLKLLSKVTKPTTGQFKVNGRIASLLEVGTGFHPEMTGRENIYLNGAILGMRRSEITRKFDEIVDFAGIERYIDTPVKRYSSGMYVRLAFAVAAHLESEILIVDEVLAVGDAEFQNKCLGKMGDVSKGEGRTVLFVSHNMLSLAAICNSGIVLKNGNICLSGNINSCISNYMQKPSVLNFNQYTEIDNYVNRRGSGESRFKSIKIKNTNGLETNEFNLNDEVIFEFEVILNCYTDRLMVNVALFSNISNEVVYSSNYFELEKRNFSPQDIIKFKIIVKSLILNPGSYPLYFWLGNNLIDPNPFDVVDKVLPNLIVKKGNTLNSTGFVNMENLIIES
jgi:lipopolysaccharide transport system ATP-binding protein